MRRLFNGYSAGTIFLTVLGLLAAGFAVAQISAPVRDVHPRQGEPRLTTDGRFAYFGSPEGWITQYDLLNLRVAAKVRTGSSIRDFAISGDGRWIMVASEHPDTLTLFDASLHEARSYPLSTLDGKVRSGVSRVFSAAPRQSFVIALKDIPELWEISYDPKSEPIYDGLVHDYRMGEGLAQAGFLGVRRTPLEVPLEFFFFDNRYRHAIGTARPTGRQVASAHVINLDARRRIASIQLPGIPRTASVVGFFSNGIEMLAIPNEKDGCVTTLEMKNWQVVPAITTLDPHRTATTCREASEASAPRSKPGAEHQ